MPTEYDHIDAAECPAYLMPHPGADAAGRTDATYFVTVAASRGEGMSPRRLGLSFKAGFVRPVRHITVCSALARVSLATSQLSFKNVWNPRFTASRPLGDPDVCRRDGNVRRPTPIPPGSCHS